MLLEALVYIVGYYIFAGLSVYLYSVVKCWELTGSWNFLIKDGFIAGIIPYPQLLLGWLEWTVRKFRRSR